MGKKIFSGFIPIRVRTFRDFMQKSSSTIIKKKINVKNKSICKRFNEQKSNYLATDGKIIMKKDHLYQIYYINKQLGLSSTKW